MGSNKSAADVSLLEAGLSDDNAHESMNHIVHVKQQKGIIENGIDLFAKKPKQGLALLHTKGFIGDKPSEIATFYHTEERLDKIMMGDYLGDGDE